MVNFDSLYRAQDLHVLISDVNGTVQLSAELAAEVVECLRLDGYGPRRFKMVFGAGATDAAEASRAGIPATTVIALSTALVREGLVYHKPRDNVEAIESEAVEACLRLIARYVARLEAGNGIGPPGAPN